MWGKFTQSLILFGIFTECTDIQIYSFFFKKTIDS